MEARGYELVEHTADTGLRGWAGDLDDLFCVLAEALFAVILDPATIRPHTDREIRLEADSPEELLHDWLNEINGLHQVHGEVYRSFSVNVRGTRLTARARGELIDPSRHRLRTEVKAVTWHDLRLEQTDAGFRAHVLLDL